MENGSGFASYLAKRLVGDKGFQTGVPEEARELAEASDAALSRLDLSLTMIVIIDREASPERRFALSQKALVDIGRACLKHTGTLNGVKLPVVISIYQIAGGPLDAEDEQRLRALSKSFQGRAKVAIACTHVDTRDGTVWSTNPWIRRFDLERWVARLLKQPRKTDAEIFARTAALPERRHPPIATFAVLAALVGMFIVEHLARLGTEASGLLGVDAQTLFALGGMNARVVREQGEWHRLLSAALLHVDAFHLLMNGVALGLAGYLLEVLFGSAWFLALFLVGALGGSLMGLVLNSSDIVSVGASGAIMALCAAAFVTSFRYPVGQMRLRMQLQMLQILIPSLVPLTTSQVEGHIDFAAHFGGALAGAGSGWALLAIWPRESPRPRFSGVANALAALCIAGFAGSLWFVKKTYPVYVATFGVSGLLVDNARIPTDTTLATRDVDTWGKGYAHDPRVRLFRALRSLDQGDAAQAESNLRAALAERRILNTAFPNGKLEAMIRTVLCELLIEQGRRDEAREQARPVCEAARTAHRPIPEGLLSLGVCD